MTTRFENCKFKSANNELTGSLYFTKNSSKWFIFSHGFTGHRIGPGYLFVQLAKKLNSLGFNVLSFDYSGCGESEGEFADTTITNLSIDLESAASFIKEKYQPEKRLVLGHSLGGMLTIVKAKDLNLDGLILLSPVVDINRQIENHKNIFTVPNLDNELYNFGPLTLKISFLESFKNTSPLNYINNNLKFPILCLQGDADTTVTKDESSLLKKEAEKFNLNFSYKLIKNGDHNFYTVDLRENLFSEISQWLKENNFEAR